MAKKSVNYQYNMIFILDENMPLSSIEVIENKGFYVEHVRKIGLIGAIDKKIAEYAKNKEAILITKDLDFGSKLLYLPKDHYGLLILRLPYFFTGAQITKVLKDFLDEIEASGLINKITILELGRYRQKNL